MYKVYEFVLEEKHIGRNPRFDRVLHKGKMYLSKGHKADIKELSS